MSATFTEVVPVQIEVAGAGRPRAAGLRWPSAGTPASAPSVSGDGYEPRAAARGLKSRPSAPAHRSGQWQRRQGRAAASWAGPSGRLCRFLVIRPMRRLFEPDGVRSERG